MTQAYFQLRGQSGWQCQNRSTRVMCRSGDAYPYVELTSTRRGGFTVKVYNSKAPYDHKKAQLHRRRLPGLCAHGGLTRAGLHIDDA